MCELSVMAIGQRITHNVIEFVIHYCYNMQDHVFSAKVARMHTFWELRNDYKKTNNFTKLNGTFSGAKATQGLYSWHKKRGLKKLPGSYVTCNSMTYDNKRNILYVMDGCEQTIRAFKVDKNTGDVCKSKQIAHILFQFHSLFNDIF